MRLAWLCLTILGIANASHAAELYDFDYIASGGPIQSFSFSFTAPTFLTSISSPSFTPFNISDGTNTWTMTQDLVDNPDGGCFIFGTSGSASPPIFPCSSFGILQNSHDASFILDFDGLPVTPGIYTPWWFGGDFGIGSNNSTERITSFQLNSDIPSTGVFTLTVTDVPEPGSLGLMAIGLLAIGYTSLRRSF